MRFLVDQPISWEIARALSEAGHDAVHVRDVKLAMTSDEEIVATAIDQQRIIVTQDTDYGTIVMTSGLSQPSVVLFRMRDARPSAQRSVLIKHLPEIEPALRDGAIVVIDDAAIRIRRLSQ